MGFNVTKKSLKTVKSKRRKRDKLVAKGKWKSRPIRRWKTKPLGADDFSKVGNNRFNGYQKGFKVSCGRVVAKLKK